MSLVVQSGSRQYIVKPGQQFVVDRLTAEEGSVVDLNLVYSFGTSSGAKNVQAKVVKHQKGAKIRVVKFKSKSNYHRQYGYRHYETVLEILS